MGAEATQAVPTMLELVPTGVPMIMLAGQVLTSKC